MKKPITEALLSLTITILLSVLVFSTPHNNIAEQNITFSSDSLSAEYLESIFIATFGQEFLRNYAISSEVAQSIHESFPRRTDGNIDFPEHFGGMYLDSSGNLVILTTDIQATIDTTIDGQIRIETENIRVVTFSYSELTGVINEITRLINRYYPSNPSHTIHAIATNLISLELDTIGNRIIVNLIDYSPNHINFFKAHIIDHPSLHFAEHNRCVATIAQMMAERSNHASNNANDVLEENYIEVTPFAARVDLRPGDALRRGTATSNIISSVGFRATLGGISGFITAGHGNTIGTYLYSANGVRVGSVTATGALPPDLNLDELHHLDFAFVQFAPHTIINWIQSPRASTQTNLGNRTAFPLINSPVARISEGGTLFAPNAATRFSTGNITSATYRPFAGGIGLVDAARANYSSTSGESGAPVIRYPSSLDPVAILGINIGRSATVVGDTVFTITADIMNNHGGTRISPF